MQFKDLIKLTCAFGAISAASPVLAQEASTGIGDVVVTAQKRATNLQDTPIAITAVSQDTLTRQGVYQIQDINRVAPEVKINAGIISTIQIRGLRSGSNSGTSDSPNAIHLDGNYMSRNIGLNGYFYDLERVEVLAGPQGTLYGRNSVGGAINIITHKPDLGKFGGSASVDIGNYNQLVMSGAANLPITENLAIRVAGLRNTRDGFFTDTNAGNVNLQSYRVSAKWQATERDTFTVTGDYQRDNSGNTGISAPIVKSYRDPVIATATVASGQNGVGTASVVAFNAPCPANSTCATVPFNVTDDIWHNRNVNSGDYLNTKIEGDGYAAQWDHDLDFATLTAQASYRTMDYFSTTGQLAGPQQDARLKAAGLFTAGIGTGGTAAEWNTQEVRLVSKDSGDQAIKYTAGVNHFHERVRSFNSPASTGWYANNNANAPGTVIGALVLPSGADGLPFGYAGGVTGNVWTDAYAVFGEATYTPSAWHALHITLGGRYNWEEKHGINANTGVAVAGRSYNYFPYPATGQVVCPAGTTPAALCPQYVLQYTQYDETRQFERATYKGSVQYDLTDANMLYATYSTGFVSGGYVFGVPQTGNVTDPNHSYNPMIIESVEIGSKNRFFDNRLQINASAYHYDFTNYLSNQSLQIPDNTRTAQQNFRSAITTVANAGASEFQGATFDVQYLLTDDDAFHISGQFTEAEIKFNLSKLYFNTTKANLASQGYNSSDACTYSVMTGSPTGASNTNSASASAAIAANCPTPPGTPPGATTLTSFFTTPLYSGLSFPGDFDTSGSFERPKWDLNADYTHTFHLPDASLDAQVAWHYTSRGVSGNGLATPPVNLNRVIPAGFVNTFDLTTRIPEKDTWDLSFRYQRESAKWSITAYVRNVLDAENLAANGNNTARTITSNLQGVTSWNLEARKAADVNGQPLPDPSYLYVTENYDPPRTFGVQFQASF